MRIAALSIITTLVFAFSVPLAGAQTPSQRGYDSDTQVLGEIGEVEETQPTQEAPAPAPAPAPTAAAPQQQAAPVQAQSDSLPFTGLEVGAVALMGVLLLGTGVLVRRVARGGADIA